MNGEMDGRLNWRRGGRVEGKREALGLSGLGIGREWELRVEAWDDEGLLEV